MAASAPVTYVLAIIVIALVFDFINGFHDAAIEFAASWNPLVKSKTSAITMIART